MDSTIIRHSGFILKAISLTIPFKFLKFIFAFFLSTSKLTLIITIDEVAILF